MKLIKRKNKNFFSIRWQLLLIILLVSSIPVILVFALGSRYMYVVRYNETIYYYQEIIGQVRNNLHIIYGQYARTLQSVFSIPEVRRGLTAPPYKDIDDENDINLLIIGDVTVEGEGGLRKLIEANIDGYVYIIETGRKSCRIPENNFVIHPVTYGPSPIVPELIKDPLYQKLLDDNAIRIIFGKPDASTLTGYQSENLPIIIVPWFNSPYKAYESINSVFICVLLNNDFMSGFYEDVPLLHKGTLYILDQFNTVVSSNHPVSLDYFEYDKVQGRYIENKDDPVDSEHSMDYSDYMLLNSDPEILQIKKVQQLLIEMDEHLTGSFEVDAEWNESFFSARRVVTFKGKRYLLFVDFEDSTRSRFLYFYPVGQIQKPFIRQIRMIGLLSLLILIVAFIIAAVISSSFTNPIKQLSEAASKISVGIYDTEIKTAVSNELGDLASSFNSMAQQISERDHQLREANIRLQNLDKIKSLFYQSVSHQLRTPLNQILGFNQLIKNRNYDPGLDVVDINNEIIDLLKTADLPKKNKKTIDEVVTFAEIFNRSVFEKEKSIYEYYYMVMKEKTEQLPEDVQIRTSELLDEMLLICSESISRMLNTLIKIDLSGEKILELLDTFSDITDLEATVSAVEKIETDIHQFLDKIISHGTVMIFKQHKEGDLILRVNLDESVPDMVLIDSLSLRTVLLNLISNAVNFSDSGNILLTIKLSEDSSQLLFIVSDEGIGIRQEDFESLFIEFWRSNDVYDRGGAGLGLSICKMIVSLLNGKISVESELGKGTRFTVALPFEKIYGLIEYEGV